MNDNKLKLLKKIIKNITKNYNIEYEDINSLKEQIIDTMTMVYNDIDKELIEFNLSNCMKLYYIFDETYDFKLIYNKNDILIPKEFENIVNHVDYLANLPQPEQRTEDWFNLRKNMITASCAAQAIGENPYSNQKPKDLILDKLDMGPPYEDNKFVHHGKKYEEIATKIYENIYNNKVEEYGLIPHVGDRLEGTKSIDFLGASPDGIVSKFKLDNSFTDRVGTMLEIKCPFSRKIKTEGNIDGEICPHYYYCQVQQQLECCDLDNCDFWQCEIIEFYNKQELDDDKSELKYKEEQNKDLNVPINCTKGCIIQLLPKNKITKFCLFDAKYIYPKNINMSNHNYDYWLLDEISNLHKKYPKLMKDYVFDRIIYWKLRSCHNVKIERDRNWFKDNYSKYEELWNKIKLLRSNPKELENFLEINKKKVKVKKQEKLFIDSDSD